jgi:hypothetical protein
MATLFTKALKERVIVTENGRRRSISKQEALVLHLVNKAVSGDRRLLQLLLDEVHVIEARAESSAVVDDAPNENRLARVPSAARTHSAPATERRGKR